MTDVIHSERLEIRPFTKEDITNEYIGWLNDQQRMRYSRQSLQVHTRQSCEDYWRSFEDSPDPFWNISHAGEGVQVGTVTAYVIDGVASVGLMIGHPGLGYGSEAFGAVLAYLFEYRDMRKVMVGTLRANEAMIRIAVRWKMRRLDEGATNLARFAILRAEWIATMRVPITVEIR